MTSSSKPVATLAANLAAPRRPSLLWWVKAAFAARSQRFALKGLDARLLADVGLTRAEAEREAARTFVDLPQRNR